MCGLCAVCRRADTDYRDPRDERCTNRLPATDHGTGGPLAAGMRAPLQQGSSIHMAVRSPEPARRGSPPCIAVAGEARSGKSSLINVLLGSSVLPTGFNDHIPLPVLVSYASRLSLSLELSNGRRVPTDWLATGLTATHNT